MSRIYVSGPAYVWSGTGSGSTIANPAWEFLGFTESGLSVAVSGLFEDVNVDYAGNMPADVSMLGQEARASGIFTQYNEQVLSKFNSFIGPTFGVGNYNPGTPFPGQGNNFSLGTLLVSEGGAIPLLCYSPYSFKNEFSTMIPGFLFWATYIVDANEVVLNVKRKSPSLTWRAIPIFGSVSGTVLTPGSPYTGYQLYTTVMPSPLPSID